MMSLLPYAAWHDHSLHQQCRVLGNQETTQPAGGTIVTSTTSYTMVSMFSRHVMAHLLVVHLHAAGVPLSFACKSYCCGALQLKSSCKVLKAVLARQVYLEEKQFWPWKLRPNRTIPDKLCYLYLQVQNHSMWHKANI